MSGERQAVVTGTMVAAGAAVVAAMALTSVWAYARLPADALVPIHWNAAGEPDGYAGRLFGVSVSVLVAAAVVVVLLLIPRIEPRQRNLERSVDAFRTVFYATIGLLAAIHVVVLGNALGWDVDPARVIGAGAGVLLVVVGNRLPTVRSNFLLGVRTPWTLTSDYTWRRTHRVAGRGMVALGVLVIIGAIIGADLTVPVAAVGAALLTVGLLAYSYATWRTAPDRPRTG